MLRGERITRNPLAREPVGNSSTANIATAAVRLPSQVPRCYAKQMQDIELYTKVLGVKPPWMISGVQLDLKQRTVTISVSYDKFVPVACPVCGGQASIYNHQKRSWRHLDTCPLKTIIECAVPRASCEDHGVKQLPVA